ncbi:hypothetical protein [Motilimonas sp. KMU-193]|uniref:hypothetical protein n=1 Tax=Motilimonas sp. KMU-193 TaxID=3388668 RepID=UPI00396B463F
MLSKAASFTQHHINTFSLACLLLAWSHSNQAASQAPLSASSAQWHYQILFDQKTVGDMQISLQYNSDGYVLESQSQLKIPSIWGDTQIQASLSEHHQLDGTLIRADNLLNQDDNTHWTKIEQHNNEYLAMGSQLPTPGQQELTELVELVTQAVIHMVPNAGHVITLGQVLLADDNKAINNSRLSQTDFDTSFAALAQYWQQQGYTLPKQIAVFDTENMVLFHASSQFIGQEMLTNKAGQLASYHYQLTLEDKSQLDLWFAKLSPNISYFAQIKGQDNGTNYTVRLAR